MRLEDAETLTNDEVRTIIQNAYNVDHLGNTDHLYIFVKGIRISEKRLSFNELAALCKWCSNYKKR